MKGYSRAHYRRVSPPADTAADIADRLRRLAASTAAVRAMREKYPYITPENFEDANAYQEKIYRELSASQEPNR